MKTCGRFHTHVVSVAGVGAAAYEELHYFMVAVAGCQKEGSLTILTLQEGEKFTITVLLLNFPNLQDTAFLVFYLAPTTTDFTYIFLRFLIYYTKHHN